VQLVRRVASDFRLSSLQNAVHLELKITAFPIVASRPSDDGLSADATASAGIGAGVSGDSDAIVQDLEAGQEQGDGRHTSSSNLVVLADSGRIAQVVRNLVSNALKFTPAEGTIHMQGTTSFVLLYYRSFNITTTTN